jgi:hypothetical protein
MYKIALFGEDECHERFIGTIIHRVAEEQNVEITVRMLSVRGGRGRAIRELDQYLREIKYFRVESLKKESRIKELPDMLIVAIDSNCKSISDTKKEIEEKISSNKVAFEDSVVYAIPEPHIERWMLVDSAAFKKFFGRGCRAPNAKCDKDEYKRRVAQAINEAGWKTAFFGIEYASEIAEKLNLDISAKKDKSLAMFIDDLRSKIKLLKMRN